MNNIQIEELKLRLQHILTSQYKELAVKSLEVAGSGVQNIVFRGESEKGTLAFRVPRNREIKNINEELSSRYSLQKEASLSAFCYTNNIPVPKVYGFHLSEELDFLISDFVVSDNRPISSYKIGELVNKLHAMPIDELGFENEDGKQSSQLIAARIENRIGAFNEITNFQIKLPNTEEIIQILKKGDQIKRLLHMDARPANLIGYNGEIKAIVDWDNALIGHPLLDLMRIVETNEVDWDEFKRGYGNIDIFESLPTVVKLFYRLDTAVMLANLFTAQLKMYNEGNYYQERVKTICSEIHKLL
jgi:aminoglycoside phosphotransferase (APT) family kinase protein